MIPFWKKRLTTGIVTETSDADQRLADLRKRAKQKIAQRFAGSLAIRMVDSGSCNACEAECNALSNPYYDLERLGIRFVASPRHADVMLLSGVMTHNMAKQAEDCYQQMPAPKWVIALGDCAKDLGVFQRNFAIQGVEHTEIPIHTRIPGCPPEPMEIIQGLVDFLESLEES
jgi:Ni,Fe-hydrogenase III small subunit